MKKRLCKTIITMIMVLGMFCSFSATTIAAPVKLSDVKDSDWYYKFVNKMVEKGSVGGYPDGTFKPNKNMSVCEFTKVLMSEMNIEFIPAKKGEHWATNSMEKAQELGIIKAQEFSKSDWDRPITRFEMARMFSRAMSESYPSNMEEFKYQITDFETMTKSQQDIALKVYVLGIISGYPDGSFGLNNNATRAEACTMLARYNYKEYRNVPVLRDFDVTNID
ncbi:S-layer homology domain-containing protein [Tepidibacter formicigenes]|jgi:hypothetical protein|uniref:S-layer homology domain-containing protein n=1 Tax=Tepidibacter formicigenes DSM 15518 TaxID=1123349 RepID=A0A1M6QJF8_9FIRM|nr:S-layer homology domain-containing protein [Tepidibacter formicigenes]SHK20203.1 S-layer homology domain-containing protein [Tepidibacter formicigenes DSM 15518]